MKQRALTISEMALGHNHPRTAKAQGNLAAVYHELGRRVEALIAADEAVTRALTSLGPEHPTTQGLSEFASFLRAVPGVS